MDGAEATPRFTGLLAPFDLRTTALLRTDVLVIGSGIAGAAAALSAADDGAEVLLVTKGALDETNTSWAQGGIAVVQLPEDSVEQHVTDTLRVGAHDHAFGVGGVDADIGGSECVKVVFAK